MAKELAGWTYVCDHQGQDLAYAEVDDPPHSVQVKIHGRGHKREGVDKATGPVEFDYEWRPELLKG